MLDPAMEILKTEWRIYGHQQPQSVGGLKLEDEDSQGVHTANMFGELLKV